MVRQQLQPQSQESVWRAERTPHFPPHSPDDWLLFLIFVKYKEVIAVDGGWWMVDGMTSKET